MATNSLSLSPRHPWLATPYGAWESVCTLWRICSGPPQRNPAGVTCLPTTAQLNAVDTRLRLAFIGDVGMMTAGFLGWEPSLSPMLRELVIGDDVRTFVADCDALVANFEGTIVRERKRRFIDQVHDPSIMQSLASLCSPVRTFLCVANNHAGDFGRAAFHDSVKALQNAGFRVFGTAEIPAVRVAEGIHLIAGSMWSNKPCDYIASLAGSASHVQAGAMNILFPHWGFEIESYPRRDIVELSRALLPSFAAIVGHHSHTPQPISAYRGADGLVRPVAYSLGNFCCGTALSRYRYGLILKLELGRTADGLWAAGRLSWTLLESTHRAHAVHLSLCDAVPHFVRKIQSHSGVVTPKHRV